MSDLSFYIPDPNVPPRQPKPGDVLPVLDPVTEETIAEAHVSLDGDGLLVFTVRPVSGEEWPTDAPDDESDA